MKCTTHVALFIKVFLSCCFVFCYEFNVASAAFVVASSRPCGAPRPALVVVRQRLHGDNKSRSCKRRRFALSLQCWTTNQHDLITTSSSSSRSTSSKRRKSRPHPPRLLVHASRTFNIMNPSPSSSSSLSSLSNASSSSSSSTTTVQSRTNNKKEKKRITIQYSPSSLQHLAAVELPPVYSRPWTVEKIKAITGAFFIGILSFLLGSYICTSLLLLDDEQPAIVLGGIGLGMGWYLFGGGQVMEQERDVTDRNGGYDAKLVADRPKRLETVLQDLLDKDQWSGQLVKRTSVLVQEQKSDHHHHDVSLSSLAMKYIAQVHKQEYLILLKTKCQETNRPVRLNPLYARTLIDEHSYLAAVNAVQDWMESVDVAVVGDQKPLFALTRPPGHHACKAKGMGGCLLNNAAIAAFYALDQEGVRNVAILDIDAHFGNGIAHCVQDEERIRYCSIHEDKNGGKLGIERKGVSDDEDNPRTQEGEDVGPLGNLLNINLKSGTGWDSGYRDALVGQALPFLRQNQPDLLIVSAGFDALESDWSSGLMLQPNDYRKLGEEIRRCFGDKVAMGLEGGYSFQNHALSEAIMEFCSAWDGDDDSLSSAIP
jgi:Deacetylases, including yeast histone deacetylase and acetoin utilization protein